MPDLTLICHDCGNEFIWTQADQAYYRRQGFEPPKYCLICRGKHKAMQRDPGRDAKKKESDEKTNR